MPTLYLPPDRAVIAIYKQPDEYDAERDRYRMGDQWYKPDTIIWANLDLMGDTLDLGECQQCDGGFFKRQIELRTCKSCSLCGGGGRLKRTVKAVSLKQIKSLARDQILQYQAACENFDDTSLETYVILVELQ